jgi:hypothetical protein
MHNIKGSRTIKKVLIKIALKKSFYISKLLAVSFKKQSKDSIYSETFDIGFETAKNFYTYLKLRVLFSYKIWPLKSKRCS